MNATLCFLPQGIIRGIYTELIDLSQLGELRIERLGTIEFDNQLQCWCVLDRRGRNMYRAPSRQRCVEWEEQHFSWILTQG